jgi:hypothetical protein
MKPFKILLSRLKIRLVGLLPQLDMREYHDPSDAELEKSKRRDLILGLLLWFVVIIAVTLFVLFG